MSKDDITKGYSDEEVKEALKVLKQVKERKEKEKVRRATPEFKAKQAERNKRKRIQQQLLVKKALEAGITVSDKEIEAAMAEE